MGATASCRAALTASTPDIAKRLGLRDIEVGDPDFDRDFVIQGNDEEKLRTERAAT